MERGGPRRVRLVEVRKFGKGIARRGDGRHVVGAGDDDVGAMYRDRDRRGDDAAMAVIVLGDVVERERRALGGDVEFGVFYGVGYVRRGVVGISVSLLHGVLML